MPMSTRAWHLGSRLREVTNRERGGEHFGPEDEFLQLRAGDARGDSAGGRGLDGGCAAGLAHGDGGILNEAHLCLGWSGHANRPWRNRRGAALGFGFALDWQRSSIWFGSERFCTRSTRRQRTLWILRGMLLRILLHERPRGLLRE